MIFLIKFLKLDPVPWTLIFTLAEGRRFNRHQIIGSPGVFFFFFYLFLRQRLIATKQLIGTMTKKR